MNARFDFDGKVFKSHLMYMENVIPELIEAERKVDEIKKSKEWKRTYNYFKVLHHRGQIEECPNKRNGYKIELVNNYVCLDEIKDILTPDQIKKIKERQGI